MEGVISSQLATIDYLELLTIQLRNQDPIDPVDQEDLINDLTQFSLLEGVENLNASFSDVLKIEQLGQGLDFVGKNINYQDANGELQSGRVSEVFNNGEEVSLIVNGESIPVSSVLSASA
ncbi:MAG: flagellar hook capping FlgD N-terminal domain-containing protein [Planctomycetota bacterium]